jgi:hydrogenase maturation protease
VEDQNQIPKQTTSTTDSWQTGLEKLLVSSQAGKIALVGMGHPLRSDDFAGSYVLKKIIVHTSHTSESICLFDGEDNVETLIMKIADLEAEHVIFVDACEMNTRPGEIRLVPVMQTKYPFFTTHGVPLKLLAEQLLSKSQVWMLAIQPKRTDFGEHLSAEIRASADAISNFFSVFLKERQQINN